MGTATAALPTGTLTFLFTDIEGSTRLLHELGESYDAALTEHRRLLRSSFERFNGQELNTEGDAFFVAFERAADAVAAALEFQLALRRHDWPHEPIKVRAGLHTGDARIVDDDLVGLAIHEAARIAAAAHGGQVLVSATTASLARHGLPDDAALLDVGRYSLKDIPGETQLLEVAHPQLRRFGRARLAAVRPNNLPRPATTLVARDDEVDTLRNLLRTADVLTIAGTAGAGKTRVAIALGAALLDECVDGVWFFDLTSATDEARLWESFATAIGIDLGETDPKLAVVQALAHAHATVILDNCEHVVDLASDVLSDLRVVGPSLTLVATSREPLEIDGETVWRVPELDEASAAQLFVERARQHNPGFELDDANSAAVARICERLDRLPLAVELAAVRTAMLSPVEIDERLADRFQLLTGGARSNARQQTLRAAIDWSYDHLGDDEQLLLRRLSSFRGSFTLDALEGVADFDHALKQHVIDVASSLVRRSLLAVEYRGKRTRYRLLESIRVYAREELASSGEADRVLLRHARWFAEWSEAIESRLSSGADASALTNAVHLDLDNVRRALRRADRLDREVGLRLAVALFPYWERRSIAEGYDAIEGFLDAAPLPTELRMRALLALGRLARAQGRTADSIARLEAAMTIEAASPRWRAEAANSLGRALEAADARRARDLIALAIDLFAQGVQPARQASAMHDLAVHEFNVGEGEMAYQRLLDAVALAQRSGDDLVEAEVLGTLALVDNYSGNGELAYARLTRVMDLAERLNDPQSLVRAHTIGAQIDAYNGNLGRAAEHNARITEFFDVAAVTLDMRNEVRRELASLLMAVGEYDKARKTIEAELATLSPESTIAYASTLSALGLVELYAGRFDVALLAYREAVTTASEGGLRELADEIGVDLVATLTASDRLPEARATLEDILTRSPNAWSTTAIALLLAEGRVADACAEFLGWLDANPIGAPLAMASPLEMSAHLLARAVDSDLGAELVGATLASYEALGLAEGAPARLRRERSTALLVDRLGQAAVDAAIKRGSAIPVGEAFAYACAALRTTAN